MEGIRGCTFLLDFRREVINNERKEGEPGQQTSVSSDTFASWRDLVRLSSWKSGLSAELLLFSLFFGIFDFVGDPSAQSYIFNPCNRATAIPGYNRDNLYLLRATAPAVTRRDHKLPSQKVEEERPRRKG